MTSAAASGVWEISHVHLILRMVMAVILGGLVGIEREWSNHAAGFRTHILVCLGSATIMLLSIYGFSQFVNETNVRVDPSRLAAQVVSGIGFLGAGAIMRNGNMIKGLTTAASVWVVAAIGLCVGAGFLLGASICTLLVLISLLLLNKWENQFLKNRRFQEVEITIIDLPGTLGAIAARFGEQGIQIANVKMTANNTSAEIDGKPLMDLTFSLRIQKQDKLLLAYDRIAALDFVVGMGASNYSLHKMNGIEAK